MLLGVTGYSVGRICGHVAWCYLIFCKINMGMLLGDTRIFCKRNVGMLLGVTGYSVGRKCRHVAWCYWIFSRTEMWACCLVLLDIQ
jgi:hypothetical protein